MVKYIFDLDYTLYSSNDVIDNTTSVEFYDSFKPKYFMNHLLDELNGNNYIFTNGNFEHAMTVVKKMNLATNFKDILSRDMVNENLKPDPQVYDEAIKKFKIRKNETVFFFEDSIENLISAKQFFNWNTVLIDPKYRGKKDEFLDYVFPTIEEALLFFVVKQKFDSNFN
jgi:FMN phosphatase YigB (HAD superfamily)